jgi:plastocyanin
MLVTIAHGGLMRLGLLLTAIVIDVGCGREPAASAPPPDRTPSGAPSTATVFGKAPPATSGAPAVIVLEPRISVASPVPTDPEVMDQQGLAFIPSVLVARPGQPVMFRNSEEVLHNVHVDEPGAAQPVFNVATVPGYSYTHTFDRPGFYSVGCDVHPAMHAEILVTESPYAVVAGEDGTFTVPDVVPGSYALMAYVGGRRIERLVEIRVPRTEVTIDGK